MEAILYQWRRWKRKRSCAARHGCGEKVCVNVSQEGSAREGPAREGAAVEEGLGGPFAEVDRESDAVAVVAGEDHHVFVARMAAADGAHFFGGENRADPAVRDAHGGKGRVQMADAAFEPAETVAGLASANVGAARIVRGVFWRLGAEGRADRLV